MIRQIVWKEWRENRWKYVTLWLVFNAPILVIALVIGLSPGARAPFADLDNRSMMKFLPLALGETQLITSIFILATGLVAVGTFLTEFRQEIFFVFEQLVSFCRYKDIDLSLKKDMVITVGYRYCLSLSPFLQYKHPPVDRDRCQYLSAS